MIWLSVGPPIYPTLLSSSASAILVPFTTTTQKGKSLYDTKPVGKVKLEVCRTGPCMIEGAERIIAHIEKRLGIKDGETTTDGVFTFKSVECLGACGYAPMLQAGESFHEHLTEEKVDALIEEYRANPVANYMGLK